jgi:hypothetical protein
MPELDRRVRKIKAYCTAMASHYLAMRCRMAMLMPLVYDKDLVSRYNKSRAGSGAEVLREALMLGFVDDLVALTQDRHKETASLANIVGLLQDPVLRGAVKVEFCKPLPMTYAGPHDEAAKRDFFEQTAKEHSKRKARQFDALWSSIVTCTNDLVNGEVGKKLKGLRNKVSSHYEMSALCEEPRPLRIDDFDLKWGDPERYMEEAKKVIFDTVLLVTNTQYALETSEREDTRIAKAFWGIADA